MVAGEGGELLEGAGEPLPVVAVEPGSEAFFDDGVVVFELHELGLVHLPELVVGQVASRYLHLGEPLDAQRADVVGGALDAVYVTQAGVGVDDRPARDRRVGGDLGHLHPHRPAGPGRPVGDDGDAVGRLEGYGVPDALLVEYARRARSWRCVCPPAVVAAI